MNEKVIETVVRENLKHKPSKRSSKDVMVVQKTKIGPYTHYLISDNVTGLKAIGVSRCSDKDTFTNKLGENIAFGRALKALNLKLNGKELREWYLA